MIYHSLKSQTDDVSAHGTFEDLDVAVEQAVASLSVRMDSFDVLVVQGTSGMSIAFPATLELQARGWRGKIVVIRKPDEDAHGGKYVGLRYGEKLTGARCVFLDDFVSMGTTRSRVREAVEASGGRLVAQYMSRDGGSYETL